MSYPTMRYNRYRIMSALKSRRGFMCDSRVNYVSEFYDVFEDLAYSGLGCVFTTPDELTEHAVRQNIRMCTRQFKSINFDCSPISKDDYEQSVEVPR
jgi:hypothetical protein